MTLSRLETDFLGVLRAALAGEPAEPESGDYEGLFSLAGEQKLLPFVYEALHEGGAAGQNPALFAGARMQVRNQVLNQTMRSAAFRELYGQMRQAGLHPVVVKGQLCSRLYPKEDFRLSGDDDLWLPEEEMVPCHDFLVGRGLVTQTPEEELAQKGEISYRDPRGPLHLEVHRRLFDEEDGAQDLNEPFEEGLRHPVETQGFLSLAPQDHLLYLILHAYKHFVLRGVGIRQLCDIGLWAGAYFAEVDWAALRAACEKTRSLGFAAAAFGICRVYLGMDLPLPDPWTETPPLEPLCHDALDGGIYGSADGDRLHASTLTRNAVRSSRQGKKKLPLATAFPPLGYLVDQYPYLRRHPGLLPWAWAQRLGRYAAGIRKEDNSPAGAVKLAQERMALLKLYGVME